MITFGSDRIQSRLRLNIGQLGKYSAKSNNYIDNPIESNDSMAEFTE
jgi:hypothetical protein